MGLGDGLDGGRGGSTPPCFEHRTVMDPKTAWPGHWRPFLGPLERMAVHWMSPVGTRVFEGLGGGIVEGVAGG